MTPANAIAVAIGRRASVLLRAAVTLSREVGDDGGEFWKFQAGPDAVGVSDEACTKAGVDVGTKMVVTVIRSARALRS